MDDKNRHFLSLVPLVYHDDTVRADGNKFVVYREHSDQGVTVNHSLAYFLGQRDSQKTVEQL